MPNPIPVGYNDILNTLIAWGQSGLKPGATVVKSYHPPIKDPQTGIEVLLPATTFKNATAADSRELTKKLMALPKEDPDVPSFYIDRIPNSWGEEIPTINSLPNAPYAGSGISDFNVNNDDPLGPQTFVGMRGTGLGALVEYMIKNTPLENNPPPPVPLSGSSLLSGIGSLVAYQQAQKKYVKSLTNSSTRAAALRGTSLLGSVAALAGMKGNSPLTLLARTAAVDRLANEMRRGLPRVTDRVEDAKVMIDIPYMQEEVEFGGGLAAVIRAGAKPVIDPEALPEGGKAFIPRRYELKPTGIPCAIPGILNCIMTKYDTVDTTDKVYNYTAPKVGMYYVSDNDVRRADGYFEDDGNTIRLVPIDPDTIDNPPLSIINEDGPDGLWKGDIIYGR